MSKTAVIVAGVVNPDSEDGESFFILIGRSRQPSPDQGSRATHSAGRRHADHLYVHVSRPAADLGEPNRSSGVHAMSTTPQDRASTSFHTMAELSMAQQFLVPAMGEQGLQITAGGHSITLLPGRLADRLADELAQQLRLEVLRREAEEFMRGVPA